MNKTLKKHDHLIKVLMTFGCICAVQSAEAQTITKPLNSYRGGDEITRLRVPYVEPGNKGENCIWEYDGSVSNAKECKQSVSTENGAITCLENHNLYHYSMKGDSLVSNGFENRTTRLDYLSGQPVLKYPFAYGDSIGGYYCGKGVYSDRLALFVWGKSYTVADAKGVLVNGNDTLRNIVRTHQHVEFRRKTPVVSQSSGINLYDSEDSIKAAIDSISAGMTEDRYRWYMAGYRYPVMESISYYRLTADGTEPYSSMTYMFLPDEQKATLQPDKDNERVREQLAENAEGNPSGDAADKFPVELSDIESGADGKSISFNYTLSEGGSVSFCVYDSNSRLISAVTHGSQPEGTYTEHLALKCAPNGSVMLHTIVNGQSKIVKIKM
jgi:hypothetical protein